VDDLPPQVPTPSSQHDEEVYGKERAKQQNQPRQSQAAADDSVIAKNMLDMLIINQKRAGVSDEQIHSHLQTKYGIESRKEIKKRDLNEVLRWIEEQRTTNSQGEPGSNG
jgi:hypothetical protein